MGQQEASGITGTFWRGRQELKCLMEVMLREPRTDTSLFIIYLQSRCAEVMAG